MRAVSAQEFVPAGADLDGLRAAAETCRGCELWEPATQTVFSAGRPDARMVLVGEQPGDVEDQQGKPFVGPAGRLLVKAIDEAGIDRAVTYRTNAVKHFRFTQDGPGKRRIHQTPEMRHITACRPWLVEELRIIDPVVTVCLGATAAQGAARPGRPGHQGPGRDHRARHQPGAAAVPRDDPSVGGAAGRRPRHGVRRAGGRPQVAAAAL